ncbi:MAG: acyl-ACP--UDP-N-acetylglucosamine O-acyltransferase [Gammaproteobacteria bacterium]|nr:acyl-ACP--UDP-N-acetylglucosamine O-acyltransferase [Gammaproteobacteria bacterium]
MIDARAAIHASAQIAEGVSVGPFAVIGPDVVIAEGCKIDAHVTIHCNTQIGTGNHICSYSSIGSDPQDLGYKGEPTRLEVGNDNVIREYVSISRGSAKHGLTKVGNSNNILAYSHIAHDCIVGNHVLFVNNATLAGHVTVDDHAILGAFATVHQFCRIGSHSFLSRIAQVTKDVPPFIIIEGLDQPRGLNSVGLRRHGFTAADLRCFKKAYRLLYREDLPLQEVLVQLKLLVVECPQIQLIVDLVESSKRGIARKENRRESAINT